MTNDSGTQLTEISQALSSDGYYISPDISGLPQGFEKQLKNALQEQSHDVFAIIYPVRTGDIGGGDAAQLLALVHDEMDTPGAYLAVDPVNGYSVDGEAWGSGPAPYYATSVARDQHRDDLAQQLLASVQLYGTKEAREKFLDQSQESTSGSSSPDDSGGANPVNGTSITLALALVAALAFAAIKARKKPSAYALPTSVAERVTAARDNEYRRRAREEVLALGEAVDAAEIQPEHDQDSWQQAIDYYAAARAIVDAADDRRILDTVGAIVLAGLGTDALGAAKRGEAFHPPPRCLLHPLHSGSTSVQPIATGEREVKAPVCNKCRADLKAKRVPDILDISHRGKPRHYFDTDVEPWASTGYGALKDDLLAAWIRQRG